MWTQWLCWGLVGLMVIGGLLLWWSLCCIASSADRHIRE